LSFDIYWSNSVVVIVVMVSLFFSNKLSLLEWTPLVFNRETLVFFATLQKKLYDCPILPWSYSNSKLTCKGPTQTHCGLCYKTFYNCNYNCGIIIPVLRYFHRFTKLTTIKSKNYFLQKLKNYQIKMFVHNFLEFSIFVCCCCSNIHCSKVVYLRTRRDLIGTLTLMTQL